MSDRSRTRVSQGRVARPDGMTLKSDSPVRRAKTSTLSPASSGLACAWVVASAEEERHRGTEAPRQRERFWCGPRRIDRTISGREGPA